MRQVASWLNLYFRANRRGEEVGGAALTGRLPVYKNSDTGLSSFSFCYLARGSSCGRVIA
ncbi:hypothetical protein JZ751_000439 [Albula glossodonta]|uniref:Uncharacterized protein n=1 Tax=Albula glossodonta TaxID=121402 RepID=A0A8T2PWA2_9TELE|nr:hypothetical protein JZ751_000439 [Albula glossodonta]